MASLIIVLPSAEGESKLSLLFPDDDLKRYISTADCSDTLLLTPLIHIHTGQLHHLFLWFRCHQPPLDHQEPSVTFHSSKTSLYMEVRYKIMKGIYRNFFVIFKLVDSYNYFWITSYILILFLVLLYCRILNLCQDFLVFFLGRVPSHVTQPGHFLF